MFREQFRSGIAHVGLALRQPEEFAHRSETGEVQYPWRVWLALMGSEHDSPGQVHRRSRLACRRACLADCNCGRRPVGGNAMAGGGRGGPVTPVMQSVEKGDWLQAIHQNPREIGVSRGACPLFSTDGYGNSRIRIFLKSIGAPSDSRHKNPVRGSQFVPPETSSPLTHSRTSPLMART